MCANNLAMTASINKRGETLYTFICKILGILQRLLIVLPLIR